MARQAREKQKTTVFSIKQKTSETLFRDVSDRKKFVSILESSKLMYNFDIYGYCLLDDDEFWIILNAKQRRIASIMQSITISYALYRDDVQGLFSNRYQSLPIYSKESLEQEVALLKADPRYESCSYCFYNPVENIPLPFISLLDQDIKIKNKHSQKLSDEAFIALMDSKISQENKENIALRNEIIKEVYANHNVTQKQLGMYFELTSSSISKILRLEAQELNSTCVPSIVEG